MVNFDRAILRSYRNIRDPERERKELFGGEAHK